MRGIVFDAAFSAPLTQRRAAPLRSRPTRDTDGRTAAWGEDGNPSLLIMDHNQPQDHREKPEKNTPINRTNALC